MSMMASVTGSTPSPQGPNPTNRLRSVRSRKADTLCNSTSKPAEKDWESILLRQAVEDGNILAVKTLWKKSRSRPNPNGQIGSFMKVSPLRQAFEARNPTLMVQMLLKSGLNPLHVEEDGQNGVHLAASKGHADILQLLLEYMSQEEPNGDSHVNACSTPWLWTALHHGAANNHLEVLKFLLNFPDTDVNATDVEGNTALLIASENGHTEAVKILLQHRAAVSVWNSEGLNCLTVAASKGRVDVVRAILEGNLEYPAESTAEGIKVADGFPFINASDTSPPKWTALHHAASKCYEELLKVLLQHPRINVDATAEDGSTALMIACERGSAGVVEMLLQNGANLLIAKSGWNCLHAAVSEGHAEVVETLLKQSDAINTQDENQGNTALMIASQRGHTVVVEILLECGADVSISNVEGSTCLHLAAREGRHEVIQALLSEESLSIDIDATDAEGNTALIIASAKGYVEAVETLLDRKANPLICNKDGFSCIHVAAGEGQSAVLKLLLEEDGDDQFTYRALEASVEPCGPQLPLLVRSTSKARLRSESEMSWKVACLLLMEKRSSGTRLTALHLAAKANHLLVSVQLLRAYLTLVLKMHGFTRHPRDKSFVPKFLQRLSNGVSNRYKIWAKEPRERSVHDPTMRSSNRNYARKSKKSDENSNAEKWISASEDQIIRGALMKYWMSLNRGAGDWWIPISSKFHVNPGDEYYFVENLVDAYMKLVQYSNAKDSSGRTFLHYVADQEFPGIHEAESCPSADCPIRILLAHVTVDLNASDSIGETPLHLAVRRGNRCLFRHCMVPGRDLNLAATNKDGDSVLRLVFRNSTLELELHDVDLQNPGGHIGMKAGSKFAVFEALETVLIQNYLSSSEVTAVAKSSNLDDYTSAISLEAVCQLLWSLKERLEHRQIPRSSNQRAQLTETFQKEHHYDGLTLLHYVAFRGLHQDLQLLLKSKSHMRLVNRPCWISKWTPLHYGVYGGNKGAVEVLLDEKYKARTTEEDKSGETPFGIAIKRKAEYQKKEQFHIFKDIEQLLLKDSDVLEYNKKLLSDRQVLVDASNAILVGAALIASVTFAGWLQPPLGYVDYNLFSDPGPPPGSTESFAAIAHYPAVQVFWVFNSLSFFFAVATVICGAGAVVQATGASSDYIRNEVRLMRLWLMTTSTLLAVSIVCVLGAFAAAGFAALPPSRRYRTSMIVTASLGIPTCVLCLICFFWYSGILLEGLLLFSKLRDVPVRIPRTIVETSRRIFRNS